jgi:DNA-binding response OmpR family regulator
MGRKRTRNSLMTKLEKMIVGEELFTEVSSDIISVYLHRLRKKYPTRKYTRLKIYTHRGATFRTLKDFVPITCLIRFE